MELALFCLFPSIITLVLSYSGKRGIKEKVLISCVSQPNRESLKVCPSLPSPLYFLYHLSHVFNSCITHPEKPV